MQKIVLDTNVIVSALIQQKGYSALIVNDLVLSKKVKLCLSKEVWEEYIDVLNRDKFSKISSFKSKAAIVLSKIEELASFFVPTLKIRVIMDVSDNKFLELAIIGKAEYVITGNKNDFTMSEYKGIKIVTPKEYWEYYK